MSGMGNEPPYDKASIPSIAEARARRAQRRAQGPSASPSLPDSSAVTTVPGGTAGPDPRRGRRVASAIATGPPLDPDAILDRLEATAANEQLSLDSPAVPGVEADEILALLDSYQSVQQTASPPSVPRGSADLQPAIAPARRSHHHAPVASAPRIRRPRRPSFALLLGGCVGLMAVLVVLGFGLVGNETARHQARSPAVSTENSTNSSTRAAQVPVINLSALVSEIAEHVRRAELAVDKKTQAARKTRARHTETKVTHTKKVIHTTTHPASTTPTSPAPAPTRITPVLTYTKPAAESSDTAATGTVPSDASASSSNSSSQSSVSSLGGVVGSSCNPTCK